MKIRLTILSLVLLLLTSCASYNPVETPNQGGDTSINIELLNERLEVVQEENTAPAGFWYGLWHGIILPFSVIGIGLGNDIGIYETYNTGNWYNFGFLIGVGVLSGGSSSKSKK